MVAGRARAIYDEQAKQRMIEGGKSAGNHRSKGPANLPDLKQDSHDAAGRAVGVSGK